MTGVLVDEGVREPREGRVSLHYRFTFSIERDAYILLRVGTHDLLK